MGESFQSNEILNRPKQWWGLLDTFGVQFLKAWHGRCVYRDAFWAPVAVGRSPQEAYP